MSSEATCKEYTVPEFLEMVNKMSTSDLQIEHASILEHQEYYRKNLKTRRELNANERTALFNRNRPDQQLIDGKLKFFNAGNVIYNPISLSFDGSNAKLKSLLKDREADIIIYFVSDSPVSPDKIKKRE